MMNTDLKFLASPDSPSICTTCIFSFHCIFLGTHLSGWRMVEGVGHVLPGAEKMKNNVKTIFKYVKGCHVEAEAAWWCFLFVCLFVLQPQRWGTWSNGSKLRGRRFWLNIKNFLIGGTILQWNGLPWKVANSSLELFKNRVGWQELRVLWLWISCSGRGFLSNLQFCDSIIYMVNEYKDVLE